MGMDHRTPGCNNPAGVERKWNDPSTHQTALASLPHYPKMPLPQLTAAEDDASFVAGPSLARDTGQPFLWLTIWRSVMTQRVLGYFDHIASLSGPVREWKEDRSAAFRNGYFNNNSGLILDVG